MTGRLTKRDVETLLGDYDRDPVEALTGALRRLLGRPEAGFDELVDAAPVSAHRREDLHRREVTALDELVAELNETRVLRP